MDAENKFICECGKVCRSQGGLDWHKEYQGEYIEATRICEYCGKEFQIKGHKRQIENPSYCRFCSESCAARYSTSKNNEQRKDKISKSIQKLNREYRLNHLNEKLDGQDFIYTLDENGNIRNSYDHTCVICGKSFTSSHYNTQSCSEECYYELLRRLKLESVKNGTHKGWRSRNIISWAEQFFINVLDNNKITYIKEYYELPYFLDFLIQNDSVKFDLEIDGKQHKYPDRLQHDKERDAYLTSIGYIVYRIDWNEVNSEGGKLLMKSKIDNLLSELTKYKLI